MTYVFALGVFRPMDLEGVFSFLPDYGWVVVQLPPSVPGLKDLRVAYRVCHVRKSHPILIRTLIVLDVRPARMRSLRPRFARSSCGSFAHSLLYDVVGILSNSTFRRSYTWFWISLSFPYLFFFKICVCESEMAPEIIWVSMMAALLSSKTRWSF